MFQQRQGGSGVALELAGVHTSLPHGVLLAVEGGEQGVQAFMARPVGILHQPQCSDEPHPHGAVRMHLLASLLGVDVQSVEPGRHAAAPPPVVM